MKNYKKYIVGMTVALGVCLVVSCSKDFLNYDPKGSVTAAQLTSPTQVDALVIAAYASLISTSFNQPAVSEWVFGSVRSDDSYKGGSGTTDQGGINNLEQYNLTLPDNSGYAGTIFSNYYSRISRVNLALQGLEKLTDAQMPLRKVRMGEMRFLRGFYHFKLKQLFKFPPYADHKVSADSLVTVSNSILSDDQLWDKIGEDFQYALDNLPDVQPQKGRANKFAAAAFLGKLRLYQAYQQNPANNAVTSINQARLTQALALFQQIIDSGKYGLFDNFGKNFTYGYENGVESIMAVQCSMNDGTAVGRIDQEHSLNYGQEANFGCCSFHNPSQNMVNAFRTQNGLPMFTTFNNVEMKATADFQNNTFDPRLDHTVVIPTHPFKYDLNFVATTAWARTPAIYGQFLSMKETQLPANIFKNGAFVGSAHNIDMMRYDDVLLMKAEALIELNQLAPAMTLINQVRQRAANSTQWLKYANNTTFSKYDIALYDGVNLPWTQANARMALQWERRLEFAMESPRFFDLVRWGIADVTLNAYLAVEKVRHTYLSGAVFTKGRDEYAPIPLAQINAVAPGIYKQNVGY